MSTICFLVFCDIVIILYSLTDNFDCFLCFLRPQSSRLQHQKLSNINSDRSYKLGLVLMCVLYIIGFLAHILELLQLSV